MKPGTVRCASVHIALTFLPRCNYSTYRNSDTSEQSTTEWKNAYTPREAFEVVGPSARRCFDVRPKKTGDAVTDFGLVDEIGNLFKKRETFRLIVDLLTGGSPTDDKFPYGFHETFFVKRVADLPAYSDRLSYDLATPAQRKIVREIILENEMEMDLIVGRLFTSCPSVAGYAYEAFVKRAFSHGTEPVAICWSDSESQPVTRPTSSFSFDLAISSAVKTNALYYPITSNFPSLDYFFVTQNNEVVLLQATVSQMHTSNESGIKKVLDYIHANASFPLDLLKYNVVYVVPFPSNGEKLVRKFKGRVRKVSGHTLRIGYTQLQFGNKVDELLSVSYCRSRRASSRTPLTLPMLFALRTLQKLIDTEPSRPDADAMNTDD